MKYSEEYWENFTKRLLFAKSLSEALFDRNIEVFRAVLESETKPIDFSYDCKKVFSEAVLTAGCAEFVEEFLKAGFDPNYVVANEDLAIILMKPELEVIKKSDGLTPLNYLAKYLKSENADEVFEFMNILLQYLASPYIGDSKGMTPLHYIISNQEICESKKQEFMQLLIPRSGVDIDKAVMEEIKTILKDKYPNLKLPEREEYIVTYDMLLRDIRNNDETQFKKYFTHYSRSITEYENLQLLVESIKRGLHLAFDLIIKSQGNYYKFSTHGKTPLETACLNGNWYALKKLLKKPDLKLSQSEPPLIYIVKKLDEKPSNEFGNYWKCFNVLLEADIIDIDQRDENGYTALYYAVKYRHTKAIKELLKRDANICVKSFHNELLIEGMDPKILEERLNECISTNGTKFGDENFQILINFRNLTPKRTSSLRILEVMAPIVFMAKTMDYRHLLQHPVITSYLFLKWHKLSLAFYINFILYLFYALSIITHVVLKFKETEYETAAAVFVILSWLGIGYLIIREILQFFMFPLRYLSSLSNYVEILLITLSIMTCLDLELFDVETERILAILTILLSAAELYLLVGSLPVTSISTHMLMLEAVCKSFFKSFLLYSIFVITFTICFYIMHDSENGERFNNFPNLLLGLSKTIVMLTGELDAANLKLDTYYSQLIFLLFVFFMTIILFNLLNGLAVSDTQTIKDQAELNFIVCLIQLLARFEKYNIERANHVISLENHLCFNPICICYIYVNKFIVDIFKYFRNLCPDFSTHRKIVILPNDNNKILMPKPKLPMLRQNSKTSVDSDDVVIDQKPSCCFSFKPPEMDKDSIQLAMDVLTDDEESDDGERDPEAEGCPDGKKVQDVKDSDVKEVGKCCRFSFITGNCSKMDERIVKSAIHVLERKTEENNDWKLLREQLNQIMQKLDNFNQM